MRVKPPISRDEALEAFSDAIRKHVGRGRRFSARDVAYACGVKDRAIGNWFAGGNAPELPALLSLCRLLGPAFTSRVLAPASLGGVERIEAVPIHPLKIAEHMSGETTQLLECLADGRFCHRDRTQTAERLLELSRLLEQAAKAMRAEDKPRLVAT